MTVPSTPRRSDLFEGDNALTTLPFSFKAFDASDVRVDRTDVNGVTETLVLDSDYSLTLNADQSADPGGEAELTDPLLTGELAVVLGGTPHTQAADLPSGGRFNDEVIEQGLDRIVFQIQQLAEEVSRAARVPTTAEDAEDLNEAIAVLTTNLDTLNTLVDNIAALVTLSDLDTEIAALAAISTEIEAVAAIAASVVTVAGLDTEIAALAAIAADIETVAADSADIQLLADNIGAIATKANAGANSDITSLSGLTTPLEGDDVAEATDVATGVVRLATSAEAPVRTNTAPVLTPATLRDALAAQNDAPIYACRAWVNFNGTGTVAIRASGNVSSITDNGVGNFSVNFATPLPDANYAGAVLQGNSTWVLGTSSGLGNLIRSDVSTASTARIYSFATDTNGTGIAFDPEVFGVGFFR